MFQRLFRKKPKPTQKVTIELNARLQPIHRGYLFEDPLVELLETNQYGSVFGGNSVTHASGELATSHISIDLFEDKPDALPAVARALETLGAPTGSSITDETTSTRLSVGSYEGIGLYLNGSDLNPSIYASCDSHFVYTELDRLLKGSARVYSYWEGPEETAFYMYGPDTDEIRKRIDTFRDSYPLCEGSRLITIT